MGIKRQTMTQLEKHLQYLNLNFLLFYNTTEKKNTSFKLFLQQSSTSKWHFEEEHH